MHRTSDPKGRTKSQFVEGRHWHILAVSGAERIFYYWNPYGTLDAPSEVRVAVHKLRGGWKLVEIACELQSDGYQCAPWTHIGLGLFIEYFRAGEFDGFAKCFATHPTLRPLDTELSAAARRRAKAVNDSYVANMRDTMRAAICDADNAEEDMPFRPVERTIEQLSSPELRRVQAQGSKDNAVDIDDM